MSTLELNVDPNEGGGSTPVAEADIAEALKTLRAELKSKAEEADSLRTRAAEQDRLLATNEGELHKVRREASDLSKYAASTEYQAIVNRIAAIAAEQNNLEADMAQAVEVADGKRVAAAQRKLSDYSAQRVLLEQGKETLEERFERAKTAQPAEAEPVRRQAAPSTDPLESDRFRSLPKVQQDWLKEHREYLTPNGIAPKALSAYYAAQAEGFRDDSPAFVAHMDKVLGHAGEVEDGEVQTETPKPTRPQAKRPMVAAPASNGGSAPSATRSVRLKAHYVDIANRQGMKPDEYYQYAVEATQHGSSQSRAEAKAFLERIRA